MDYRKDTRTPRDRVDDELLRRLLSEAEEMSMKCGCMATPYQTREDRSARRERREERREGNDSNSCGCSRRERREERREDNDTNSCGCTRRERREEHREDSDNNSCGCSHKEEKHEHEDCSCMNYRSMSFQTQGLPHVMSYAPDHEFHELHEAEEALEMGTLFRELHFPFHQTACGKDKDCGCN